MGEGLGSTRTLGAGREFIPRNAPEIFERGVSEWRSMFWDSRVAQNSDGTLVSPAGENLPSGVHSLLGAQAKEDGIDAHVRVVPMDGAGDAAMKERQHVG